MIHYNHALELIQKISLPRKTKLVSLETSNKFVLAEDIYSDRDYPPFNRSLVDGYAISNSNLDQDFKVQEIIFAGDAKKYSFYSQNHTFKIMTGARVPEETYAVIKIEDSTVMNPNQIRIKNDLMINKNLNIARKGQDSKKGEIILPRNTPINFSVINILASIGKKKIKVFPTPKVAILSTGNEIIHFSKKPKETEIRDSNGPTLTGLLEEYKIHPSYFSMEMDDKNKLKTHLAKMIQSDILIFTGGVSMGDSDFLPELLQELGVKKIFHHISIKPGKPIFFGIYQKNKFIFGLPGNPFSVQVTYKLFVEPIIRKFLGLNEVLPLYLPLINPRNLTSIGKTEIFPCKLHFKNPPKLEVLKFNTSGSLNASIFSDGIGIQRETNQTISENENIEFFLWKRID